MTARLYLAPDSYGDETIWRDTGDDRDEAVLTRTGGNAAGFDALATFIEERDRLKRGAETLGKIVDNQCRMVLDATGMHDAVDETGDGDWGAIWDHLFDLGARAERAEAKVARVEALAASWEADSLGTDRYCAADLRAALGGDL